MTYLNGSTMCHQLSSLWNLDTKYSLLIAVRFCGSLTTKSSFALKTTNLIDSRQFHTLALNILSNVGLSIGAVYTGRIISSIVLLYVGSVVRKKLRNDTKDVVYYY